MSFSLCGAGCPGLRYDLRRLGDGAPAGYACFEQAVWDAVWGNGVFPGRMPYSGRRPRRPAGGGVAQPDWCNRNAITAGAALRRRGNAVSQSYRDAEL